MKWRQLTPFARQELIVSPASEEAKVHFLLPGRRPYFINLTRLNSTFACSYLNETEGANFECKRNAARANIKGAFRAFLGANYQNLNEIVRHNGAQKYPIVNLRVSIMCLPVLAIELGLLSTPRERERGHFRCSYHVPQIRSSFLSQDD